MTNTSSGRTEAAIAELNTPIHPLSRGRRPQYLSLAQPRTTGNKKTKQNKSKKYVPETDKPRPERLLSLAWPVGARTETFVSD